MTHGMKRLFGNDLTNNIQLKSVSVSNHNHHMMRNTNIVIKQNINSNNNNNNDTKMVDNNDNNNDNNDGSFSLIKQNKKQKLSHGSLTAQVIEEKVAEAQKPINAGSNVDAAAAESKMGESSLNSSFAFVDNDNNEVKEEEENPSAYHIQRSPEPCKWDRSHGDDDLQVPLYARQIIINLRASENGDFDWCRFYSSDFMRKQQDLNPRMRHILVDWLVEVHRKFRLLPSTLFLGINLLDRFLAQSPKVLRSRLQLLGCCCLWIASKYHEIYSPEMEDFVYISDHAFTGKAMVAKEEEILKILDFTLTVPTFYSYAQRYAAISSSYLQYPREQLLIKNLVRMCIEHACVSYDLCSIKPSLVAAAAFVYACIGTKVFTEQEFIEDKIADAIGYEIQSLLPVLRTLHGIILKARESKFKAITKKYSSSTYSNVAKLNFAKLKVGYFMETAAAENKIQTITAAVTAVDDHNMDADVDDNQTIDETANSSHHQQHRNHRRYSCNLSSNHQRIDNNNNNNNNGYNTLSQ